MAKKNTIIKIIGICCIGILVLEGINSVSAQEMEIAPTMAEEGIFETIEVEGFLVEPEVMQETVIFEAVPVQVSEPTTESEVAENSEETVVSEEESKEEQEVEDGEAKVETTLENSEDKEETELAEIGAEELEILKESTEADPEEVAIPIEEETEIEEQQAEEETDEVEPSIPTQDIPEQNANEVEIEEVWVEEFEEELVIPNQQINWDGGIPAWVESEQPYLRGNIEVAEQFGVLKETLLDMGKEDKTEKNTLPEEYEAHINKVIITYAIKNQMLEDFPYQISVDDSEAKEEMVAIFEEILETKIWVSDSGRRDIEIESMSLEEIALTYEFDEEQIEQLENYMTEENNTLLIEQYSSSIFGILTDEEFTQIQELVPEDVYGTRRSVILAALSLEGKVPYFWGGKSLHTGWDERWGEDRIVTSEGSTVTGTQRAFGMDCSGFVTWAFINAGGNSNILKYIGNGTAAQWKNSKGIGRDELQPGDLLFYQSPNRAGINHIGIVVQSEDELVVVHSSGGRGVVVTGREGFQHARRPYIYSE